MRTIHKFLTPATKTLENWYNVISNVCFTTDYALKKKIDCGLTSSPGLLDAPNQTEEKRPGNEVATTSPAHGIAKFVLAVCSPKRFQLQSLEIQPLRTK